MIFNDSLCQFLGVVGDATKGEGSAVLDGDGGVEEEGTQLLEDTEGVQVVDVLRLGSEVCQLLGEFDLSLLELLESCLQRLHRVTKLYDRNQLSDIKPYNTQRLSLIHKQIAPAINRPGISIIL